MSLRWLKCAGCGDDMPGIMAPRTHDTKRTHCEDCGGNTTEYNAANPRPKVWELGEILNMRQHA